MKKHSRALLAACVLGLSLPGLGYGAIIISEVDPSGSSATNNTYQADWFELTNTGASAVNITGWKMDDNSHAFATAVAIRNVTSIAAGQSVVFVEGNASGSNDGTLDATFKSFWFGSNVPAGFTIGNYGGAGVGLSQTADEVNIYDSTGIKITGVGFGASATGVSFDNAAGIGGTTTTPPSISQVSVVGVNGAFNSANNVTGTPEVGSPGVIANYRYALTTHNNATLGTLNSKSLTVVGSNKDYADPGPASNYTPANGTSADYAIANATLGVGGETPVLVMVDFNLGSSGLTVAQLEGLLSNAGDVAAATVVGPGDSDPLSQRALLFGQYPSFNAATTLLFEFTSAPGATSDGLHFGFDLTGSGVSVNQAIAVPEPASLGLLGLAGLGLVRRRQK